MEETVLVPLSIEPQDVVYRDRVRSIQRVLARFDGFTKEFFVSDHGERAALVVVHQGNVLLTRQYRLIINRLSYEIPGGRIEPGEAPDQAAARECLEETGFRCSDLHSLIDYHAGLDIWRNFTRVFYACDCQEVSAERASHRVWVPLVQCIEMVFAQQIVDSMSIIALLAYQTAHQQNRLFR